MDKLKNKIREHINEMEVDEPNAATWTCIQNNLELGRKDFLKEHIAINKNELEIEAPGKESWKEISNSISVKERGAVQRLKRNLIYLSAACILTLFGLGLVRYMNGTKPDNDLYEKPLVTNTGSAKDTISIEASGNELAVMASLSSQSVEQVRNHKRPEPASKPAKKQKRESLPMEVLQVEKDYDELIAGQMKYTKSLAIYGENPAYFQEFMDDFMFLEEQEKELRKSIVQNGLQENSINDLTTIYQQKLTILKKLQTEINKTSNRNKDITDTIPTYLSL